MGLFNTVVDVGKDIISEIPKDFKAIQNVGQMLLPGGERSMTLVRNATSGALGGDSLRTRSVKDQLSDIGRAGIAVGSFLPVAGGVKAGAASVKYGSKALREAKNLRVGKHMYKGAKTEIKQLKPAVRRGEAEAAQKLAAAKARKKMLAKRNLQYGPSSVKYIVKNAGKSMTGGIKSTKTLVPAATPRSASGVEKRQNLGKSTLNLARKTGKTIKLIGGMIV